MRSWGFEGRLEEEQVRKLLRQLALYPLPRTLVVAASSRKEVLPPRDLGGGVPWALRVSGRGSSVAVHQEQCPIRHIELMM